MAIAAADWRDASSYARLLPGDRRCFAWEWLRRTPAYVEAWAVRGSPASFELVRLEDPARDALSARPMWMPTIDCAVLRAHGAVSDSGERLDFSRFGRLLTTVPGHEGLTHVLLSNGLRTLRLDVNTRVSFDLPMALTWSLTGVVTITPQLLALEQFSALARLGRFSRSLHSAQRGAHRWIAMLRAHDAAASGATAREIVEGLFGVEAAQPRWRTTAGSWRLRAQRLLAAARACLEVGPSMWLGRK